MSDEAAREINESVKNATALLKDQVLYGMSFTDVTSRRIDPRTMEPWCSMDLPDLDDLVEDGWGPGFADVFHHEDGTTR